MLRECSELIEAKLTVSQRTQRNSPIGQLAVTFAVFAWACLFVLCQPLIASGTDTLQAQQIRYISKEAGQVLLVWGINGWTTIPETQRPAGTFIEKSVMHTPMAKEGDDFVATIQAPRDSRIDFGFLVTSTKNGAVVRVWEADGPLDFHRVITPGSSIVVGSTVHVLESSPQIPHVLTEVRYDIGEAGEVFLVWGTDGWKPVPESRRPPGTILANGVMKSPMRKKGNTFVVEIQAPAGSVIEYGFLITKLYSGDPVQLWDANDSSNHEYAIQALKTQHIEIAPTPSVQQAIASLVTRVQLVPQEISYLMPDAGEVFLVWGVNGWQAVPANDRPLGTVITRDVQHTPMVRKNEAFSAIVRVPLGASIDYGFLTTKTLGGDALNYWENADQKPLRAGATGNGHWEVQSKVSLALITPAQLLMSIFAIIAAYFLITMASEYLLAADENKLAPILIIGVTILGLLARLWAVDTNVRILGNDSHLVGDEPGYHFLAVSFLEGHFFEWPGRLPVYPLFLSAVYKLFGQSLAGVLYTQAFIGTLVVPLTFFLARQFIPLHGSLMASALVAVHPSLIQHVTRLYTEVVYAPLLIVSILCLIRAIQRPSTRGFLLAGVILAITNLCRPSAVLFPLVLLILLPKSLSVKRKITSTLVYAGAMILIIAPWSYHNYRLHHAFVPLSSSTALLWQGSPEFYHLMENKHSLIHIWDTELDPAHNGGHDPFSIEGDRYFTDRAISSILKEPIIYLWYTVKKLGFFWIGHPASDWPDYAVFGLDALRPYFSSAQIVAMYISRLLPLIALVSLCTLYSRLKELTPLIALCGYFMLLHAVSYAEIRYSEPLYPILAIFIAAALARLGTYAATYRCQNTLKTSSSSTPTEPAKSMET